MNSPLPPVNFHLRNNREVVIRPATPGDAEGIISFAKDLFASSDQVLTMPEEFSMTLEDERTWIKAMSEQANALLLVSELDGEILSMLDIQPGKRFRVSHTAELGMSVHPAWQGMGLGQRTLQRAQEWAREHSSLERIFLKVFSTNPRAMKLYMESGFMQEGHFRKAARQKDGSYMDMYQLVWEARR